MNEQTSLSRWVATYEIVAIIIQEISNFALTKKPAVAGTILLILAVIALILNIIAAVKNHKNGISMAGAIWGIVGSIIWMFIPIIGLILLIISAIILFRQKPNNN